MTPQNNLKQLFPIYDVGGGSNLAVTNLTTFGGRAVQGTCSMNIPGYQSFEEGLCLSNCSIALYWQ
jgi:hypothetical protein